MLEESLESIYSFLREKLELELHPYKVELRKASKGIDFLGYVILLHVSVLRTKTKQRIGRKIKEGISLYNTGRISQRSLVSSINSYIGVFSHARAKKEIEYLVGVLDRVQKKANGITNRAYVCDYQHTPTPSLDEVKK